MPRSSTQAISYRFTHAHFSDAFIEAQRQARSAMTDAESVVELSYQALLTLGSCSNPTYSTLWTRRTQRRATPGSPPCV